MLKVNRTTKYIIATALTLIFNSGNSWVMAQEQQTAEDLERARATKEISFGLRFSQRAMPPYSGFVFIGSLDNSYWKPVVLLADNQGVTIKSLDLLIWRAKMASINHNADYLDTNPKDYKEYMKRNKSRRKEALKHGQMMTLTGLLTVPQLNAVIPHYFSLDKSIASQGRSTPNFIGITETQRSLLYQLNYRFKKKYINDSMAILTPTQRTQWKQLRTKRPSLKSAPTMTLPTEAEQKRIDVKKLSNVFRSIVHLQKENKLNLSEKQKKFLDDLYLVTQHGLFWIETTDTSQSAATKNELSFFVRSEAEFLKHAGQVALQGILTEHQAKQVQDAL